MIKITKLVGETVYYINVNLVTQFRVDNLSDSDGNYRTLTIHDLSLDERECQGFEDAIAILDGLTLKIQYSSPLAIPSGGMFQ